MKKYALTMGFGLFLLSCSEHKPIVFSNDLEPHNWTNLVTIKNRPNAHSGATVSISDSTNPYSLCFNSHLAELGENVHAITYSYWVMVKNPEINVVSVFSIEKAGKCLHWQGPEEGVKLKVLNQWVQVVETFEIPKGTEPDAEIKLYALNKSKDEVLYDDFEVKVN